MRNKIKLLVGNVQDWFLDYASYVFEKGCSDMAVGSLSETDFIHAKVDTAGI